MNRLSRFFIAIAIILCATGVVARAQSVVVRDVPEVRFPNPTDSNSPAHWDGDTYYLFNSSGRPVLSNGTDQFDVSGSILSTYNNEVPGRRWIECTWPEADGVLYGWYHMEPAGLCPNNGHLTAPKIGAVRSTDNGASWTDLGIVLEARPGLECNTKNGYFAGGHGDFSVMLDKNRKYMYFFFGAYSGDVTEQGVAVARMEWKHREKPAGKVYKYYDGKWEQPGVGGKLSPIFPATVNWKRSNAEAYWGPSIHWNTHLKQYVILLNRTAETPGWPPHGVHITYSKDLSNPNSWSQPKKIADSGGWYPQVLGVNREAKETDKLCGKQARLYTSGVSNREIIFFRDGEDTSSLPPVYVPKKAGL